MGMSTSNIAQIVSSTERANLAESLRSAGPTAPTLCTGWNTRDLLAHLIMSDSRLDGVIASYIPFTKNYAKSVADNFKSQPYEQLVTDFRSGPSRYSVFAIPGVDNMFNSIEFLVHNEDVRRSVPEWKPRELDQATKDFIWNRLISGLARLLLNGHRQGVTLHRRDSIDATEVTPGDAANNTFTVRTGPDPVVLTGDPIELLLACYGRRAVVLDIAGTTSGIARWDRR